MRLQKSPIPSDRTKRHADGWLTAVNALAETKAGGRPGIRMFGTILRCFEIFEGAAHYDFKQQLRRDPSQRELDTYCRGVIWYLTLPGSPYRYLRPSDY